MKKLHAIIAKALKFSPHVVVSDAMTMANTSDWDSLAHMELVLDIEEQYGINLTADNIVAMRSVKAICQILRDREVDTQSD